MARQVIRIYLASSPDLKEERRLALEVLQELNETKAAERNVCFKLVNPEPDDPDSDIRAEAQIARSALFVLMLWKSWEEHFPPRREAARIEWKFRFAQSAFAQNAQPRSLIYFRSVLPFMMADPGVLLQQVINFRNAIEADRTNQFTIYDHPLQWRSIFLSHLSRWLDEPQGKHRYVPPTFPRALKDSLYLRLRHELDTHSSPIQRRAVEYAIQALDLLHQGRLTAAEECFARALDMDDGPVVLHSFGVYLQRIGSLDRAEKIFKRLLTKSLAEEDADATYQSLALRNLGLVYARRAANEPAIIGTGLTGKLAADYMAAGTGYVNVNLRHSFELLPYAGSPKTLEHGLATAFRSKDTEPFGQMVSHLYHHSPLQPRVEVLQTLVSDIGGASAAARLIGGGIGLGAFGGWGSRQNITEREAAHVAPEGVRILATHAQQKNPLTVDNISRIYSGYPEIVKNLGAKPLSITLSSMAEREATNPKVLVSMKDFFATSKKIPGTVKGKSKSKSLNLQGIESSEDEPPSSLVANSWFEDENGNPLPLRTTLIVDHSYKYLFAIEKVKRLLLLGASDLFKEPPELARAGTTKVELEVICPLLVTNNPHKVSRRTVRYYSGTGIRPQSFPLHAGPPGDYFLTLRVFYVRRLLYRAVVPISVAAEEVRAWLATRDQVSRPKEMLRGDHV